MTRYAQMTLEAADAVHANAAFSVCERYRFTLSRLWSPGPRCMFLMLNPSTADALQDDPTIRRCIAYARRWEFGGLWVGNLFAWRATDPTELPEVDEPIGFEANDTALSWMADDAELVVCAWGDGPRGFKLTLKTRAREVLGRLGGRWRRKLHRLGTYTSTGHPRHPLYLRGDLEPSPL